MWMNFVHTNILRRWRIHTHSHTRHILFTRTRICLRSFLQKIYIQGYWSSCAFVLPVHMCPNTIVKLCESRFTLYMYNAFVFFLFTIYALESDSCAKSVVRHVKKKIVSPNFFLLSNQFYLAKMLIGNIKIQTNWWIRALYLWIIFPKFA